MKRTTPIAGVARWTFAGALLLTAGAGCNVSPSQVETSYGPRVPYDGFGTTFGWKPNGAPTQAPARVRENKEALDLIRSSIEHGFENKGYRRDTSGSPDFWLTWAVGTRERIERVSAEAADYEEGVLVIEIFDPKSSERMWHGAMLKVIDPSATPDERRVGFEQAVAKILADFPRAPGRSTKR